MIFRTPFFLPWLYPDLIWRIPTKGKEIYLTFDDGPIPGPTEWALDELAKVNARATFFCIGENVCKHPDIFRKVVEQGHTIGNHTFNHIKGWNCSVSDYVENTRLCEEQLENAIISDVGLTPTFAKAAVGRPGPPSDQVIRAGPPDGEGRKIFRPPYGRIKCNQIKALSDYKIIMWDVLTFDYAKNISDERCLRGSIHATRPGSIIVFHDSLKAEKKMRNVLPRFLEYFDVLGYSFKAIPNF